MPIDLQKLEQKVNALLNYSNFVTEFEQWLEARNVSQNSGEPIVSGALPPIEDEVLHYFYHIGAADALAKAISRNGGKPDFEKRLKDFREGQGGNAR